MKGRLSGILVLLAIGAWTARLPAQPYTSEVLPPVGGQCHNSLAYAMNDLEVAVGRSGSCPARWFGGVVDHLGGLGGTQGEAIGINSVGQVVGYATTTGDLQARAFVYNDGTGMIDIGTLGGDETVAWAINNGGQIVGHATLPSGAVHAFLWTPHVPNGTTGTMLDLGLLGGWETVATGINDASQVVGFAFLEWPAGSGAYLSRAFLYTPGVGLRDLGTLGGTSASAWSINSSGDVVGESENGTGVSHAFLWQPNRPNGAIGTMLNLGLLDGHPAVATHINDNGDIVGGTIDDAFAFRYVPGYGLVNLNDDVDPSVSIRQAVAVTAGGRIAGWAKIGPSLDTRGVILVP